MRIHNKQELIKRHPDLIRDVFSVWESNIFIYLDLLMFAVLFSLMLLATGRSFYVIIGIPSVFFIIFICTYKLALSSKENIKS